VNADRARHHRDEARVPVTGEIEETDDVARIRHPRDDEADAEQRARDHRSHRTALHGATPGASRRCATATVTAPAAMNVAVAISEAIERREMPQTPWPDVQPPPRRVPNPTSTPATTNTDSG